MSKRELSPDVTVVSEPKEPEHITNLRKAKAVIADPINWCKNTSHRMLDGHHQFCALGAVARTCVPDWLEPHAPTPTSDKWGPYRKAEAALNRGCGAISDALHPITQWMNDAQTTTHADVMALFDLAIEAETKDWLRSK